MFSELSKDQKCINYIRDGQLKVNRRPVFRILKFSRLERRKQINVF